MARNYKCKLRQTFLIFLFLICILYICIYYNITILNTLNISKYDNLKKGLKRQLSINCNCKKNINSNKYNFKYIHNAKKVCLKITPLLVILVKSKVNHFEERMIIRKTWATKDKFGLIRTVFLLGIPNPDDIQDVKQVTKMVEKENSEYNDIVQKKFYDAYFNNTLQILMGLEWIIYMCMQAKFYLFIDDDNFMNPKLLIDYLTTQVSKDVYNTFYGGHVFFDAIPLKNSSSTWYMPKEQYPYQRYPPYISGSFFILAPKTVKLFYKASFRIPLFKFDDVYLGMLAYALDIKPTLINKIYYYHIKFDPNLYANNTISVHKISGAELKEIWQKIGQFIMLDSSY